MNFTWIRPILALLQMLLMTRMVTSLKPNMEIAKVIKKLYGETDGIFLLYDLNQEPGAPLVLQYHYTDRKHPWMTSLPPDIPSKVEEIHLSFNYIKRIPHLAFYRFKRSKIIQLQKNNIETVSAEAFFGLKALVLVDLSHNRILQLPGLPELSETNPDMYIAVGWVCSFPSFPNPMFHLCNTLPDLVVSNNDLVAIGTEFTDMRHLERLSLSHNRIADIKTDAFFHLEKLRKLELNMNKLTVIRKGIFAGLVELQLLNLSGNHIHTIEKDSFEDLKKLSKFDLKDNGLVRLSADMFKGLNSLFELCLARNRIKEIEPGSFRSLHRLRLLDLGRNRLMRLRTRFLAGLSKEVHIFLCWNRIEILEDEALKQNQKAVTLYLSGHTFSVLRWDAFRQSNTVSSRSWKTNYTISVCDRNLLCNPKQCWMRLRDDVTVSDMRSGLGCDWISLCPDKDLCVNHVEECNASCTKFGLGVEGWIKNDDFCPGMFMCVCFCNEFNDQACALKCYENGTVPEITAVDTVGCRVCECKCPEVKEEACSGQCQKRGMSPVQRKTDEAGCRVYDCACPLVTESTCAEACARRGGTGSNPVMERTDENGCTTCDCTCAPADKDRCERQCAEEWRYPVLGVTDEYGCHSCLCSCQWLTNTTCQTQCALFEKVPGPEALIKIKDGCPTCDCQCEKPDCQDECLDHPYEVVAGVFGCDVCSCGCRDVDCDVECGGPGRGTVGAPDPLGCPTCAECKPSPTRDPRTCPNCDAMCEDNDAANKLDAKGNIKNDTDANTKNKDDADATARNDAKFNAIGIRGEIGEDGCPICLGCRTVCVDCRTDCPGVTWKNMIADHVTCQSSCDECVVKRPEGNILILFAAAVGSVLVIVLTTVFVGYFLQREEEMPGLQWRHWSTMKRRKTGSWRRFSGLKEWNAGKQLRPKLSDLSPGTRRRVEEDILKRNIKGMRF